MKTTTQRTSSKTHLFDEIIAATPPEVKMEINQRLQKVVQNSEALKISRMNLEKLSIKTGLPLVTISLWLDGWDVAPDDIKKIANALETKETLNIAQKNAAVPKNR